MRNFLIPSLFGKYDRLFDRSLFNERELAEALDKQSVLCDYRVEEEENLYNMEIDLPGVADKDIDVSVEENMLKIKAERKREVKDEEGKVTEKTVAKYERSFSLSEGIDKENIHAISKDGMLMLTLPKKSPQKETKKITINKANA